uniref:MFS domain-containing protein n=1 Tax=Angiostrongylus cantonensis TaxID=6313 RepID=A0A0K0CV98_ANGCA
MQRSSALYQLQALASDDYSIQEDSTDVDNFSVHSFGAFSSRIRLYILSDRTNISVPLREYLCYQGVAFSATFPIIGAVTADWAVLTEHGLFVGLLTGCTQLSNMFTMPVSGFSNENLRSGALCSTSWGWQSVYYVHAGLSVFAFCCWVLIYKDRPDEHALVSAEELSHIQEGKLSKKDYAKNDIPFRAILSSKTLWGALPVAVQFFLKLVGGVSSDMLTCFDETCKLRVYNSLALGASAIFFATLAFIPRENRVIAIVVLVFAESLLGLNTAGFNKCATLHSRQYGHFVMTQIMNIWALTILLEPFVVHAIVAQNDYPSWRNCFLCHAIALLICNAIFCLWADAKPAPWTNVNHSGERSKTQLLKNGAEEAAPSGD